MRILLINQYAGAPSLGMEYRPHWMALEWQRLGHEVLVVAGDHSHLRRAQPHVGRSRVEGAEFLTLRTPRYSENGPRRFANILAFRTQLYRGSRSLAQWRPDTVIASSTHPMDVRPALRVARKVGAVFVHEVHDLWPLTPKLLGGMPDRHPMIMWMQREEDLACKEADLVVSMLPATLPYLQSRGLEPSRWAYVSNGVPAEAIQESFQPQNPDGGAFRVGYFGGHALSNDLGTLVEAARLLQDESIEFHLTGAGPLKEELQRQAHGLSNLYFHDPVPLHVARQHMGAMDALCILGRSTPLYQHGFSPNKMFEYMAVGKPTILAIDTPASPAQESGSALVCKPGDADSVAEAVLQLRGLGMEKRAQMGRAGREYVFTQATYPRLASDFLAAVKSVDECGLGTRTGRGRFRRNDGNSDAQFESPGRWRKLTPTSERLATPQKIV